MKREKAAAFCLSGFPLPHFLSGGLRRQPPPHAVGNLRRFAPPTRSNYLAGGCCLIRQPIFCPSIQTPTVGRSPLPRFSHLAAWQKILIQDFGGAIHQRHMRHLSIKSIPHFERKPNQWNQEQRKG